MKIEKTKFKNLIIIHNKRYNDHRGYFKELLKEENIKKKFPFIVTSYSKKNVLRGLHYQEKNSQGKFITIIKGKIFDVSVDLRKNSKTYGKYFSCILSDKNSKSIYIPEGFAHGFYTLEKDNYIIYSCTNYRNKKTEKTLRYDDKQLKIRWPLKYNKIIISKKDLNGKTLAELSR